MSQYKGRIQQLNVLEGKMQKKLHGLKIRILPINTLPKAEFKPIIKYRATWDNGISFGGMVKKLNMLFRFIAAKARILLGMEAKASTAPAITVEAERAFHTSTEAPLSAHPVTDLTVDQTEKISVLRSKLVAYRRAALSYIKQIFMGRTAELSTAPGAIARFVKVLPFVRKTGAVAANSAIAESRYNTATVAVTADGSAVPTETNGAIVAIPAEVTANAIQATSAVANSTIEVGTVTFAQIGLWLYPQEVENGLIIKQIYSAEQSGNILEVT